MNAGGWPNVPLRFSRTFPVFWSKPSGEADKTAQNGSARLHVHACELYSSQKGEIRGWPDRQTGGGGQTVQRFI